MADINNMLKTIHELLEKQSDLMDYVINLLEEIRDDQNAEKLSLPDPSDSTYEFEETPDSVPG